MYTVLLFNITGTDTNNTQGQTNTGSHRMKTEKTNRHGQLEKTNTSLTGHKQEQRMQNKQETNVDYKYTGEWTLYAGILGSEEELKNYERWETH